MSRFKLMLMAVAILMTAAAATAPPVEGVCVLYSACRLCADGVTQQPCDVTRCPVNGVPHYFNCGDCVTDCVPFDI